jgi:hypothetical protein
MQIPVINLNATNVDLTYPLKGAEGFRQGLMQEFH